MRIVSLLASGTEIICALGRGAGLVGRSHECDNPAWVRKLPSCTRPAFDVDTSSEAIDREVRRRLQQGLPLYYIDGHLISRLTPDLLITQEHCEVCAVTPSDIAKADCGGLANHVLALGAGTVEGIYDGICAVGNAADCAVAADRLIFHMRRRIDDVYQCVRHNCPPRVVILEWTEPVFPASNWIPELVEAANGQLLLGGKGEHSGATPWSRVRDADPDFVIAAPCGFNLQRTLDEVPVLEALPGWFEMKAVKHGHVALADGNKFFNRSGTTIVETVEIIAEILHGARLSSKWEGTAWQRYARPSFRNLDIPAASTNHEL